MGRIEKAERRLYDRQCELVFLQSVDWHEHLATGGPLMLEGTPVYSPAAKEIALVHLDNLRYRLRAAYVQQLNYHRLGEAGLPR
jgi:hypothetical protein